MRDEHEEHEHADGDMQDADAEVSDESDVMDDVDMAPRGSADAVVGTIMNNGSMMAARMGRTRRERKRAKARNGSHDEFSSGSIANAKNFRKFQESVEPWESTLMRRQSRQPWPEMQHKDVDFLMKLTNGKTFFYI